LNKDSRRWGPGALPSRGQGSDQGPDQPGAAVPGRDQPDRGLAPKGDEKAPRSRGQADQWAKPPSKTIREAVEKGAERINILYNWRLDGKKADMPIEK
jgi:hypothetical protein